jgi:glycosyltransferase involved in cell wall biosynthesis
VKAATKSGRQVIVASRRGQLESEDAQIHLGGIFNQFERIELNDGNPTSVAQLSKEMSAAQTVVPDGDRFALRLALTRGWRGFGSLSVLIMREVAQSGGLPGAQAIKTALRRLLFRRAGSFPNVRVAVLKSAWWTGKSEFPVARDPITLRRSSSVEQRLTAEWALDPGRYWFAVLGAISQRKNVDLVAQALSGLDTSKLGLLVAGAWDESVGDETASAIDHLRDAGASTVVINRKLQDDELDAAVALADCLVLAHSNEGPSGLLGKAAAAGTRVVAAGARSLRKDLQYLLGLGAWVELEESELARALGEAARVERPERAWGEHADDFVVALL